jgi:hypothetical protein
MKEEHLLLAYDYSFAGGVNNSYVFESNFSINYEVKFKPTPYLLDSSFEFSEDVYEMAIQVVENETGKRPPLDRLIPITIANIFKDFYRRCDRTITFYICESADAKQEVRMRKFNSWFEYFRERDYMKFDFPIFDKNDKLVYQNAIILKQSNPYFFEIIREFRKVSEGYGEDK